MIKAILLAGLCAFTVLELRTTSSARRTALRRIGACVILVLGATAVLFPDGVTRLANAVGVGRGADLVLYALVLAFLFSTVRLYQRLARLEERYVELARRTAIAEALGSAGRSEATTMSVGTETGPVSRPSLAP